MADTIWVLPAKGAAFSAGDKIHVKWKSTQAVLAPSFRLCLFSGLLSPKSRRTHLTSASHQCGSPVWPMVKDKGGASSTTFIAPDDLKALKSFILRMDDGAGTTFDSPSFSLAPAMLAEQGLEDATTSDYPQSPMGTHTASSSTHTNTIVSDDSDGSLIIASDPTPTSWQPVNPSSTSATNPPSSVPNVLLSHKSPNTASFAVPLTIVVVMFMIGVWFAFRHHRNLARERARDTERLEFSLWSNENGSKLSGCTGPNSNSSSSIVEVPIPPFMPPALPSLPTRAHKKPVPDSALYTNTVLSTPKKTGRSRPLSVRSTYSQTSAYLPPIMPASGGLFDEEHVTKPSAHGIITDYFQPSPPISPTTLEPPTRARITNL